MRKDLEPTIYNKKKEFEKYCSEKLEDLRLECHELDIPMFFAAAVSNENNKTEYILDGVYTAPNDIVLFDDQISKYMSVAAGFKVQPYDSYREIIMNGDDDSMIADGEDSED